MDQVKEFLRQCVKYRFWIIVGTSLLLPIIAYFVGAPAIIDATTKQEAAIKGAQADIQKYTGSGLPNNQWAPIVVEKKDVLTKDVDASWRKLFAVQEPLLRWPDVVESQFRKWGRKWPENVDRGQVQQAIIDYSIAYPEFVSRVYKTFKPWNPEDGTGIVAAPDEKMLLVPAPFTAAEPPQLGAVWAEQERLWVLTALLDVVAKVNESVGATDWDKAIIKQINVIEVGTPTAQDQKSLAQGKTLDPAPVLSADGTTAPAAPAAEAEGGMAAAMRAGGMMGGASKVDTVYSIKGEPTDQFKVLPIKMTVLLDQAHLADFLVGLENSPMTIQVMEPEIAKPTAPVVKPVYGQNMNFGSMGMGGMNEGGMMNMGPGVMSGYRGGGMMGGRGMEGGMEGGMMMGGRGMMGGMMGGNASTAKQGTSIRDQNKAAIRKATEKDAAKTKTAAKVKVDQHFNVIEVTVYGQARFYNAPPPPAAVEPSTAPAATPEAPAATPEAPKAATPAPTPAATPEAPKTEAPKDEVPKVDAPKAEAPTPGADGVAPKK